MSQYLTLTNKQTWVLGIKLSPSCWRSKLFTHGTITPALGPLCVANSSMQIHMAIDHPHSVLGSNGYPVLSSASASWLCLQ